MAEYSTPQNVLIVYFSGTGCTRMAAEELASGLRRRGVSVLEQELRSGLPANQAGSPDMLVLMYPVYAFNAPKPVDAYLKTCGRVEQIPAAVISVSGGGEVTANKASRLGSIRRLEKKGYRVVYEGMLVMPANCIEPTPFGLALRLINALPGKTDRIAAELTAGIARRSKPGLPDRVVAALCTVEKSGATLFGRHMTVGASCTGCAVCARGCPTGNITMKSGRPVFAEKCASCLRCIYGCPQKALAPRWGKFLILKDGFSLTALAEASSLQHGDDTSYGNVWEGLNTYLEE